MNVNPIILISSCKKDQKSGVNQAIRDTWAKAPVIPYKFFIGDMPPLQDDEITLDGPDNYFSLPHKTKLSLLWALKNGYTHFFRAFTDTYIDTVRLKASLEQWKASDYVGNPCGFWNDLFMHGGPGYWLSQKAAEIVIHTDVKQETLEDYWVGKLMREYLIKPEYDFRFSMGNSYGRREFPIAADNDIISQHLSDQGNKYHASLMFQAHARRYPTRQTSGNLVL